MPLPDRWAKGRSSDDSEPMLCDNLFQPRAAMTRTPSHDTAVPSDCERRQNEMVAICGGAQNRRLEPGEDQNFMYA